MYTKERIAHAEGAAFLHAGKELWARAAAAIKLDPQPLDAVLATPAVVNLGFAAELMLKSASLHATGAHVFVHVLPDLWSDLPQEAQTAIEAEWSAAGTIAEVLGLGSIVDPFYEFRYLFDEKRTTPHTSPELLISLCEALDRYLRRVVIP